MNCATIPAHRLYCQIPVRLVASSLPDGDSGIPPRVVITLPQLAGKLFALPGLTTIEGVNQLAADVGGISLDVELLLLGVEVLWQLAGRLEDRVDRVE